MRAPEGRRNRSRGHDSSAPPGRVHFLRLFPVAAPASRGCHRLLSGAPAGCRPAPHLNSLLIQYKQVSRLFLAGVLRELRDDDPETFAPLARRAARVTNPVVYEACVKPAGGRIIVIRGDSVCITSRSKLCQEQRQIALRR